MNQLKSKPTKNILIEIKEFQKKDEEYWQHIERTVQNPTFNEESNYYTTIFKAYFEKNEILIHHARPKMDLPSVNMRIAWLEMISGGSYFSLFIIALFFVLEPVPILAILSLIIVIISVAGSFFCLFGLNNYLEIKEEKDSVYILTNKKFIIKQGEIVLQFNYEEIYSLRVIDKEKLFYNIKIYLKKPIEINPNRIKSEVNLSKIPIENEFYAKMIYIMKKRVEHDK
ncbi:MAG: hypothetical protein ACFE9R_06890 [Candidatus Hermodarchaeota archaeon]